MKTRRKSSGSSSTWSPTHASTAPAAIWRSGSGMRTFRTIPVVTAATRRRRRPTETACMAP